MQQNYVNLFKNLENNNIKPVYAENKAAALGIVKDMLFEGAVITAGGSMSVKECGIWDLIKDKKYNFLDRSDPALTEEEREKCYKASIGADFFFCSTNAITQTGELVNVDGFSNRISAIAFGPKKVIMIVGKNKIVKDTDEGVLRVKKIAAPKNCVRLGIDNPCAKLGHCVSLLKTDHPSMTDGCNLDTRICCSYLICAKQRVADRLTVILVDEDLGY